MQRGAAVVGLLAGAIGLAGITWVVAGQVMQSPAEVAAATAAPEPSLVTAPVLEQELSANLIVRGTVRFEDPIVVHLRGTPAIDGEPVVTQVPEEGQAVASGDVLLQVSGRPVFALEGEVPAYRDLRPGSTGEDVRHLQDTLAGLGHDLDVDGTFGASTQEAVRTLYEDAGFTAPGPTAEQREQLRAANEQLAAARDGLLAAEQDLAAAGRGASRSEVLQAEAAINEARDQLAAAEDATSRRRAEDQLAVAEAQLDELRAAPDTSAQSRAVGAARDRVAAAESTVAELEAAIGVWLPAGEVVYLADLPQRIDRVTVDLGDPATGELMTMTTPEIVIESSVLTADRDLVAIGGEALIDDGAGNELPGTIVEIADEPVGAGAQARYDIVIEPQDSADGFVGQSLRVRIPVSSTDGAVLAVPISALSARADGTSVVEVVDDATGTSTLVTVEPGLTADGLVEVVPSDGTLRAGDQVVVAGGDGPPGEQANDG